MPIGVAFEKGLRHNFYVEILVSRRLRSRYSGIPGIGKSRILGRKLSWKISSQNGGTIIWIPGNRLLTYFPGKFRDGNSFLFHIILALISSNFFFWKLYTYFCTFVEILPFPTSCIFLGIGNSQNTGKTSGKGEYPKCKRYFREEGIPKLWKKIPGKWTSPNYEKIPRRRDFPNYGKNSRETGIPKLWKKFQGNGNSQIMEKIPGKWEFSNYGKNSWEMGIPKMGK